MVFRPTSVTVFGALNIVFGLFGLFGMVAAVAMTVIMANTTQRPSTFTLSPAAELYNRVAIGLGFVSTLALLSSGFGLLRMRPWGRKLALGYAIYAVGSTIASTAITYMLIYRPMLEQAEMRSGPAANGAMFGLIAGLIGSCLGLIYPCLLWYFMTRPLVLAAFGETSPVADWSPDLAPRDTSNPYLSPMSDTGPQISGGGSGESVIETFVPSKNGPALVSYYLGLFSLFPCVGFFLAVPAIYYGIKGLRLVSEKPEVRGGAHAWVGVVCGSLFGLFNLVLLIGTVGVTVASMIKR